MTRVLSAVSWAALGISFPIDAGSGRVCTCCDHRRKGSHCGGPLCGCRVAVVEGWNLALAEQLQVTIG